MLPKALEAASARARPQQAWSRRLCPWLTGDLLSIVSSHVFALWASPHSYENTIHIELGSHPIISLNTHFVLILEVLWRLC